MTSLRRFAVPLLLAAVTIGFYWKLLLTNQYTWVDSPDISNQVVPWFALISRAFRSGEFPFWDPFHWGGQSLIGQAQPGVAYPLNWIFCLFPIKMGNLAWYFAAIHWMATIFAWWLCRDLGCSRTASLLGGIGFGLGGWMVTTDWPQMLNGAVWAPLILLFFFRMVRGERPLSSAATSGALLGISFLGGHHQVPMFLTLMMAGLWCEQFWTNRRRALRLAPVFGAFTALTGALQILPAAEYGRLALRWVGSQSPLQWNQAVPYYIHQTYSLAPASVLGIVIPNLAPNGSQFLGWTLVSLAALTVMRHWQQRRVKVLSGVAVGALAYALGSSAVLEGFLYVLVPHLEKARSPVMAVVVMQLAVVVLAAWGLDSLLQQPPPERCWKALLFAGGFCWLVVLALQAFRAPTGEEYDRLMVSGLAAMALAVLYRKPKPALIIMVLIFESAQVSGRGHRRRDQPQVVQHLEMHRDIAAFLKARPQPVRVELDRSAIPYNFGDLFGVDTVEGYCGVTENVFRLFGEPVYHDLLAINYYVGWKAKAPWTQELFTGQSGMKVFRNPAAHARVWVEGTTGDARLLKRTLNSVEVSATLSGRGDVVLSETWAPGWKATVDGRDAPVRQVHGFLRAVAMDAGFHRVELRYRPASVTWGAIFTTMGLLGVVILQLASRRSPRP